MRLLHLIFLTAVVEGRSIFELQELFEMTRQNRCATTHRY